MTKPKYGLLLTPAEAIAYDEQRDAARAMLATLQTIKENFDDGRAMAHGTPSYYMLLDTIAQAKAAGIT